MAPIEEYKGKKISYFYYEDGIAIYYIKRKGKLYCGSAKCHPEDGDKRSKFFGLDLARFRAELAVLKAVRSEKIVEVKDFIKFRNAMSCDKRYNKDMDSIARHQVNIKYKELAKINLAIENKERTIRMMIKNANKVKGKED